MNIAENVRRIRENMAEAAVKAGRDPKEIQLVAATKTNPAEAVREAVAAGVDACGENRVQELVEKLPQGAYTGVPVHFIGHLQRNKAKLVVGSVDLIESADSRELLGILDRLARERALVQDVLLEVNVGDEQSKSGLPLPEAAALSGEFGQYPGLRLRGFMAIPPISTVPGENRNYFAQMQQLFVDISTKKYDNTLVDCLSMGMSGDYTDAIAMGSTMVRLGTAIFGPRNYPVRPASPDAAK